MVVNNAARLRPKRPERNKSIVSPAGPAGSSPHKPYDRDSRRDRNKSPDAQYLFRHRLHLCGKPPGKARQAAIKDALDHQNKTERHQQIVERQG